MDETDGNITRNAWVAENKNAKSMRWSCAKSPRAGNPRLQAATHERGGGRAKKKSGNEQRGPDSNLCLSAPRS